MGTAGDEQFIEWRMSTFVKPRRGYVLVIICQTEKYESFKELSDMMAMIKGYTNNTILTFVNRESITIKIPYYDCANIDFLLKSSITMFKENRISSLEGVILPENMAAALAPYAARLGVPLLTYDVNSNSMVEPAVRSATGNVIHLEIAFRRLLFDCGWQRLAVISEPTQLAKVLSAALRAPTTGLTVREVQNVTPQFNITHELNKLRDADARVFLVNTAPATAAVVLAAAQKLNITPDNGFSWIVREYDTADYATSFIRPYSVSFWWRGERQNYEQKNITNKTEDDGKDHIKTITDEEDLREKLEEKWRNRAWPRHASPLLDALFTLKEGIKRYQYNKISSWPNTNIRYVTGF